MFRLALFHFLAVRPADSSDMFFLGAIQDISNSGQSFYQAFNLSQQRDILLSRVKSSHNPKPIVHNALLRGTLPRGR